MSRRRKTNLANYPVVPFVPFNVSGRDDAPASPAGNLRSVSGYTPLDRPIEIVPGAKSRVVGVDDSMPESLRNHWLALGRVA